MKIEINNLVKAFQGNEVLNIPHLLFETNQIIGFIGNNGSGKTTLFKLMLDLLKADNGQVTIEGEDISCSNQWKEHTGSYLSENFLIDFLYPEEYFEFIKEAYRMSKTDFELSLRNFEPLMHGEILHKRKLIQAHSKGNKQKIGIIGSMLSHPNILILDEPFNFLDPSSQMILKELLLSHAQTYNATILLSNHDIKQAMDICSRIIVMDNGHVLYDESTNSQVIETKITAHFMPDRR